MSRPSRPRRLRRRRSRRRRDGCRCRRVRRRPFCRRLQSVLVSGRSGSNP